MEPVAYEIQVEGRIGLRWSHWFGDMRIAVRDQPGQPATTQLLGRVTDQAALLGLLQNLYSVGLPLLLVRRIGDHRLKEEKGGTNDG
jgi:hypothetical protein